MSHYTILNKYGKRTILVFYTLGAFLMKQLFHSRLLHMTLGSLFSYLTHARGIVVNYHSLVQVQSRIAYVSGGSDQFSVLSCVTIILRSRNSKKCEN